MNSFNPQSIHSAIISKFGFTLDNNGAIKASYLDILDKNDLKIHQYGSNKTTLFAAISQCLFSSDIYEQYILSLCLSLFKKTVSSKPQKNLFREKISSVSEYLINPTHHQFDYLNLELISTIFKVKILLYFIEDEDLIATFVNYNFTRELQVFKQDQSYYPLFSKHFLSTFQVIKKITNSIVSNVLAEQQHDQQLTPPPRQLKRCSSITEQQFESTKHHLTLDVISQMNALDADFNPNPYQQPFTSLTCGKVDHHNPFFNFQQPDPPFPDFSTYNAPFMLSDTILNNAAENIAFAQQTNLPYGYTLIPIISRPITPLQKEEDNYSRIFNYSLYDQQMYGWPASTTDMAYNNTTIYNDPLMKTFSYNPDKDSSSASKQIKQSTSSHKKSDQIREEDEESQLLEEINKKTQPHQVIKNQGDRMTARLKFFDENKQYGFFVNEKDKNDIFVHLDDMQKSGIKRDILRKLKQGYSLYFSFQSIQYQGKMKQNVKAVDLKLERLEKMK